MLLGTVVPDAMARASVPGVAVGVRVGTEEVLAGYGVASVEDNPFAVQEIVPGTTAGELVLRHHAREREPGRWAPPPPRPIRLGFHAPDRVVALEPPDQVGLLGEFGRDGGGRVTWLRWGGRMAPRLAEGQQE
jgi:hypothetical protein